MVGFLSGGISASFAGAFADRFGRKAACLAYCVTYSLSCVTLLTDNIVILFAGRVLGGISGTLLYSVFESWLVAEYNGLMLDDHSGSILSGIFSKMTMLNSIVAIIAGVLAEWLGRAIGTAKAPFMASMACLSVAFIMIARNWSENYGSREEGPLESMSLLTEEAKEAPAPAKSVVKLILSGMVIGRLQQLNRANSDCRQEPFDACAHFMLLRRFTISLHILQVSCTQALPRELWCDRK